MKRATVAVGAVAEDEDAEGQQLGQPQVDAGPRTLAGQAGAPPGRGASRGRHRTPGRIAASTGTAVKATTPSVVPPASTATSTADSDSDGG